MFCKVRRAQTQEIILELPSWLRSDGYIRSEVAKAVKADEDRGWGRDRGQERLDRHSDEALDLGGQRWFHRHLVQPYYRGTSCSRYA